MPIPTTTDDTPITPAKPSQKNMSKAERRELQEKQRAEKAVLKQQQQPTQQQGKDTQSAPPKPPQSPQTSKKDAQQQGKQPQQAGVGATKTKPPSTPHRKSFLSETPWRGALKDANFAGAAEDPSSVQSHGLRIFSHFGQPKPTAQVKGDIHPAIIRLGLLFSEFKICGANARCIATLTAFKQVCYRVE